MNIRIGGWWRLWISLSVIYGVVLGLDAYSSWPTIETISYDNNDPKLMSNAALEIIAGDKIPYKGLPEGYKIEREGHIFETQTLEMPNGAKLRVPVASTKEQIQVVVDDYLRVMKILVKEKKYSTVRDHFLAWLLPCVSILAAGFLLRWIYRGFKQPKPDKEAL
jgi:hypothetical protein